MIPQDLLRGKVTPGAPAGDKGDTREFDPLRHTANSFWGNIPVNAATTVDVNLSRSDSGTAAANLLPAHTLGIVKSIRLIPYKVAASSPHAFAELLAISFSIWKNDRLAIPAAVPSVIAGADTTGGNNGEWIIINQVFVPGDRIFLRIANGNAAVNTSVVIQTNSWLF